MKTKEAIERVRSRFSKWALDDEDLIALQTLGLADVESEDEKVRKELLAVIDDLVLPNEQKARFNAYLEKQKEPKPVISNDAIREGVAHFGITQYQIDNWLKKHINVVEQKPAQYDIDILEKHITKDSISELAHTVIVRNGWEIVEQEQKPADYDHEMWKNCEANFEAGKKEVINNPEKYGLCKPTEWSEEDKVMLNNIIWSVHMKSIIKPLDEMDDRSRYKKYEDFLKALPERFNLQPKQEWSEEDEKMRDNIICILQKDITYTPPTSPNSCTVSGNAFYTHQTEIDWFKSLPERFNLQPAEWSNEEKGILVECISELQDSGHWLLADRLSSLRPQPKQECESIDVLGSIKTSRIKTLENLISYFKCERKSTQEEINTSFLPCLEDLLKNANKPSEWNDKIRKELWEYFHDLQLQSDREFSQNFTIDDVLEWLENK